MGNGTKIGLVLVLVLVVVVIANLLDSEVENALPGPEQAPNIESGVGEGGRDTRRTSGPASTRTETEPSTARTRSVGGWVARAEKAATLSTTRTATAR